MGKLKMIQICLCCSGQILILVSAEQGNAILPDQEIYEFMMSKYNILLGETWSEHSYYANLNTLSMNGDQRTVSVLLARGQPGGTACNGVFEFQVLSVHCPTQDVSDSEQIASPVNWQEPWYQNAEVAQQICSLPPAAGHQVYRWELMGRTIDPYLGNDRGFSRW